MGFDMCAGDWLEDWRLNKKSLGIESSVGG